MIIFGHGDAKVKRLDPAEEVHILGEPLGYERWCTFVAVPQSIFGLSNFSHELFPGTYMFFFAYKSTETTYHLRNEMS